MSSTPKTHESVKRLFPSCPLCLGTTFDVTPLDENDTLAEKLRVKVRCRTCQALWRLVAYDQPYITLLEPGTNPRQLADVPVNEVHDLAYWSDWRRPVKRRFQCGACPSCGTPMVKGWIYSHSWESHPITWATGDTIPRQNLRDWWHWKNVLSYEEKSGRETIRACRCERCDLYLIDGKRRRDWNVEAGS